MEISEVEQRGDGFAIPDATRNEFLPSRTKGSNGEIGAHKTAVAKEKVKVEDSRSNQILAGLPADEIERLLPMFEPIQLEDHENLSGTWAENGSVYFLTDGIVSSLSVFKDGAVAEIGVIGNEGVVGLSAILNNSIPEHWAKVVVAGSALKVRAHALKEEFCRGGRLQQLLLNYTGAYLVQVSQRSVCNSQHKIEERFAAWLLTLHDRMGGDLLPLTQEEIACCLGTRRSSITVAAIALQQRNIIRYIRGQIRILDRLELERAACECYGIINPQKKKNPSRKIC